jgi:hypothetical protein
VTYLQGVGGTWTHNLIGNVTGNASGTAATVTTPAQPAITSVGTLTSLGVTGAVSAGSFSGAGTGLTGTAAGLSIGGNAATATNVTGASQTAITTVGTLTTLSVTGAITATGGVTGHASLDVLRDGNATFPVGTTVMLTNTNINPTIANLGSGAGSNLAYTSTISGIIGMASIIGTWRNISGNTLTSATQDTGIFQRIA